MKILAFEPADNVGKYWVQDSCEAFRDLGHRVEVIELSQPGGRPLAEIVDRLKEFQPDFIFTINHIGLIPEFLKIIDKMAIRTVSWFIDDPFRYLKKELTSKNCVVFSCDKIYIQRLKDFGFEKVHYLPGATNPKAFRPIELSQEEKERYNCNISFVGNSIYHAYATYKKYYEWLADSEVQRIIEEVLNLQKENPLLDISDILEEAQKVHKRLISYPGLEHIDSVKICLEFAAMSLYRKEMVETVTGFGLKLFGDDGWQELLDDKVEFQGEIDYRTEVPKLYNISKINLNITKTQLKTTINQRVFDVAACGGFILTDYRRGLGNLFEIGDEVIYYENKEDVRCKIQYYLEHEDERVEIARNAQRRVLKGHTFRHRMDEMIEVMGL